MTCRLFRESITIWSRPAFVKGLIKAWSAKEVWSETELDVFANSLREPQRARASVQYYRTFLLRELLPTMAGRYRKLRLRTPTLLLFGVDDGVVRPHQLRGYERHADDMRLELISGVGHFTPEEAPELVVDRAIGHFDSARSAANSGRQSRSFEQLAEP